MNGELARCSSEMKNYGYAESIKLPYHYWTGCLKVHRNIPEFGFAEAVPLQLDLNGIVVPDYLNQIAEQHRAIPYCSHQDADGLWWYGAKRSLKQVLKQ